MPIVAGTRLGAYQVHGLLGAGGMGEVYLAHDLNLRRDVAIKILPSTLVANGERLARFEREARILASLNHPHICAIYGLETLDSIRALILELVEGPTLAERIRRPSGLPIDEALSIARQIADALDAAHERGIVHRDLKPANVKVRSDGVVKVLDFGLAKAVEGDPASAEASQLSTLGVAATRSGVILGTAAYMAPEQARGTSVDRRADIWAFGCLLYEMLTGRLAFPAGTFSDTLVAILERDPDWSALPSSAPSSIRRLLQRCLEKDPRHRLRDIGDALFDVSDALAGSREPAAATAATTTHRRPTWRTVALASLAALIVTAGTLATVWRVAAPAPGASTSRTIAAQLTNYGGTESAPAIAPDGRSFVFVSDHGGTPDIWLRQVVGGEPVRLTNDADVESDLAFAPDGESLYFSRRDGNSQAIWQTGLLGGQVRKVLSNARGAAPSPDGRRLAYVSGESPLTQTLMVSALDGSDARPVAEHVPSFPPVRAAWSRDGRWLSYVRAGLFAPANLFVVDTNTGRERQVTRFSRPPEGIGQHVWLPDNRHLAVSYVPYSRALANNDLAILDVQDGSLSRFTATIGDTFLTPGVSADGSRLIATATRYPREVWKIPVTGADPDANGRAGVRLMDGAMDPMWTFVSRDARTLLFNSPASGSRNLWTWQLDGNSRPQQVTAVTGDAIAHSSLSPDGMRVAFVSFATGNSDIWVQNLDGSNPRQLTNDPAADSWPVWSPDGRSIVFTSARDGAQETRVIPSEGGSSQKLIDGFFRGDWIRRPAGDGTLIVTSDGTSGVRLIDPERRSVVWDTRFAGSSNLPMFSEDGRSISVPFQEARDHNAIQILDTATGKGRLVARLPFNVIFRASWVDNDTAVIVNRMDTVSHIVLFDRFWSTEPAQ